MFIESFAHGRSNPPDLEVAPLYHERRDRFVVSSNDHPNTNMEVSYRMMFQNPFSACNFIVTWDGEDSRELLMAIQVARESGDRFIQDKLIEYILNIPIRNPRPTDIPAFIGKPVWAVDKHGRALVGMPGAEAIVDVESLRTQGHSIGSNGNGNGKQTS